jgi:hypothetical protein
VKVHVFEDTADTKKPDAVFPNNWFSTHDDGRVVLYPMFAKSRRTERRTDLVQFLDGSKKVRTRPLTALPHGCFLIENN